MWRLSRHTAGNLAIVTHGTVSTLYVTQRAGVEPMPLWRRLDLASFVVLSLSDLGMLDVVERVEADVTPE